MAWWLTCFMAVGRWGGHDGRDDAQPAVGGIDGVLIPMTLSRMGRDPAMGASVMITAVTDSGGFFIFLGLATIFLL